MTVKQVRELVAGYDEDCEIEIRHPNQSFGWSAFALLGAELRFIKVANAEAVTELNETAPS